MEQQKFYGNEEMQHNTDLGNSSKKCYFEFSCSGFPRSEDKRIGISKNCCVKSPKSSPKIEHVFYNIDDILLIFIKPSLAYTYRYINFN